MWHAKSGLSVADDEVSLGFGTIYQASHKRQARIRVADVELVISNLASEAGGNIQLQITNVSASIH